MKKLKCRNYLAQPNLTREKLWIYTQHLFTAHGRNLPREIKLGRLSCSELSLKRAYEEVDFLAKQVEENYSKRG